MLNALTTLLARGVNPEGWTVAASCSSSSMACSWMRVAGKEEEGEEEGEGAGKGMSIV